MKRLPLLVFLALFPLTLLGQVRLPRLVSDGMVLQRNADVKVWGWASPGGRVQVRFKGNSYETQADRQGSWAVHLSGLEAGGPYTMTIQGSNTITLHDVLVGDVWVASGQSNMELPMYRVKPLYVSEIIHSRNDRIRYFEVPKKYNFDEPQADLEGGEWQATTPENVMHYSAVAYFFATQLYKEYGVPVGIINSSLGGSPAEAWVSEGTLKDKFPRYYKEAQRFKSDSLIRQIQEEDQQRSREWYGQALAKDQGYKDPQGPWRRPGLDDSDWSTMQVPGYWADTDMGPVNGVVWFRKEINVPHYFVGKPAKLLLGRIVDADSVFVNGQFVGTTSYQYPPRWYDVPAGVLQAGKNQITVRVINSSGRGGFVPEKTYALRVAYRSISLEGEWKMKLGAAMPKLASQTFIRWKPVGLYNAMIAPLLNYHIKGVIWYQGESNAGRPDEYRELFSTMINNWREKWGQGEFPFLYVQLANFMKAADQPTGSNWARLREAQLQTLSVPHTGMAVTIDIGEWNDIHPLDKEDVGKRLALAADKVAYGNDKVEYSGPIYQSMNIEDDRAVLTFSHTGSGLVARGGELKTFAIAGPDHHFVWAKARIEGDQVVVWSDAVDHPVAVRYAWADNPEGANLYNTAGLPASPFRTDDWPRK